MNGYVLKLNGSTSPCMYVARAGSKHHYTHALRDAEIFATLEVARSLASSNETAVTVRSQIET